MQAPTTERIVFRGRAYTISVDTDDGSIDECIDSRGRDVSSNRELVKAIEAHAAERRAEWTEDCR